MPPSKPTIGILTGGGDCPGLNAVIRAAVKSGLRLGYDCVGFPKGYEGLVDPVAYMPLDLQNTACILLQGGTILGSTNKGRFSALVGVPKMIDNDLGCTAFTFGFDSAVACATDALDRLHTTAASHERIMVLEVTGRHAG